MADRREFLKSLGAVTLSLAGVRLVSNPNVPPDSLVATEALPEFVPHPDGIHYHPFFARGAVRRRWVTEPRVGMLIWQESYDVKSACIRIDVSYIYNQHASPAWVKRVRRQMDKRHIVTREIPVKLDQWRVATQLLTDTEYQTARGDIVDELIENLMTQVQGLHDNA